MLVDQVMSKEVHCVAPEEKLRKLRDIFNEVKYHHLLVREDNRLLGLLSDRDVMRHLSPFLGADQEKYKDRKLLDIQAKAIMSTEVISVEPSTPIVCAAILLMENNISCLPVVSEENSIVGILTWKDLLEYYVYVQS
jgi:acetoin utilization protein AcuB